MRSTSWPASSARLVASLSEVVISSSAAAVSSTEAACCSVRLARSSEAERISAEETAWMALALLPTERSADCSFSTEALKS